VQIGAFSTAALADKGWSDVAALAPAGMSGKGRKVEPISRDGKTFYRAYVTGFPGRDAAQAFCDRLKAAGKACFVK
jgi:cell division protein FtsN